MNVNEIIEKTAAAVASEFKKQGLVKENRHSPYEKTEQLLYNYRHFKGAIEDREKQIEALKSECDYLRSGASASKKEALYDVAATFEALQDKIATLEHSVAITRKFVAQIDDALAGIQDDPYYEIIPLKYFEGLSREAIADEIFVDVRTISRHKTRLVNLLQIRLFTDDYLYELLI